MAEQPLRRSNDAGQWWIDVLLRQTESARPSLFILGVSQQLCIGVPLCGWFVLFLHYILCPRPVLVGFGTTELYLRQWGKCPVGVIIRTGDMCSTTSKDIQNLKTYLCACSFGFLCLKSLNRKILACPKIHLWMRTRWAGECLAVRSIRTGDIGAQEHAENVRIWNLTFVLILFGFLRYKSSTGQLLPLLAMVWCFLQHLQLLWILVPAWVSQSWRLWKLSSVYFSRRSGVLFSSLRSLAFRRMLRYDHFFYQFHTEAVDGDQVTGPTTKLK